MYFHLVSQLCTFSWHIVIYAKVIKWYINNSSKPLKFCQKSPDLNNIKPVWNVLWPGAFIERSNILLPTVQCLCSSSTRRNKFVTLFHITRNWVFQCFVTCTCRRHANQAPTLSSEYWKMLRPLQGDQTVTYSHFVVKPSTHAHTHTCITQHRRTNPISQPKWKESHLHTSISYY